jgi:adenylate cyclase
MQAGSPDRVDRRLAAILAADVVGYSRLMEADEEGTLVALKAIHSELSDPKIPEHRGRIVKKTGDGLLVEFQSVVDAARCAVAWQMAMGKRNAAVLEGKRIEFRIGVNLGDIIIDQDDIFGDGVNIAARLEALAEPGGICLSGSAHEQVRDKLDLAFEDLGERQVKNIARPVRVYRVRIAAVASIPKLEATPALALPDKPSIAVLPFTNMSSDPEQEFFADGIAEDIITALSRYPSLFVLARNSCFSYKGQSPDVRQVGRELGVRYVLEGSLRKSGNRIRVTAQLIKAETGNNVWAERYDRDLAGIFAVQDEISEAVTIAIAPAIADAEQQRAMRKPPGSPDAWTAYQRGLWHLGKATREHHALAEKFFRQTIDLDPNFAGGYRGLADARGFVFGSDQTLNLAEGLNSREMLARRAVELDSADAEARSALAHVLAGRGDYQAGLVEARQALAITPNLSIAHGALGFVLTFSGQPKEGLASLETAIRLDPHGSQVAVKMNQVAIAQYYSGEYDAAVERAIRIIRSWPD